MKQMDEEIENWSSDALNLYVAPWAGWDYDGEYDCWHQPDGLETLEECPDFCGGGEHTWSLLEVGNLDLVCPGVGREDWRAVGYRCDPNMKTRTVSVAHCRAARAVCEAAAELRREGIEARWVP